MNDPWTTHTVPRPQSDVLKELLSPPNSITIRASATGKLFSVNEEWKVYSISLTDFSVAHMKSKSVRRRDQKPSTKMVQPLQLSPDDKYLLLPSEQYDALHRFDLVRMEWTKIVLSPPSLPPNCARKMGIRSSKLYLFYGTTYLDNLLELELSSGQLPTKWERIYLDNLPQGAPHRYLPHECVSSGQKLFLCEGAYVWEYNSARTAWEKVLVAGGQIRHRIDHMLLVNDTLFALTAYRCAMTKLGALNVTGIADESSGWLGLTGCVQRNQDSAGLIVSDQFRMLSFRLNAQGPMNVHTVDTRHAINPISGQLILGGRQPPLYDTQQSLTRFSSIRRSIERNILDDFDISPYRCAKGGFCEVFLGTYKPTQTKLALKLPRMSNDNATDVIRRSDRETQMWATFDNDNILPFLGLLNVASDAYMVSPWMELGDLSSFSGGRVGYLKQAGEGRAPRHVKHALFHKFDERTVIRGIAAGIDYLHSQQYVHGDLKGTNVLLDNDLCPLLCDFGLTKALGTPSQMTSTAMKGVGTFRWSSPELLFDEKSKSFESDVYAFSMIMVEVLTGQVPIPQCRDQPAYCVLLKQGMRPSTEPASRNGIDFRRLWNLAGDCWKPNPKERPTMRKVVGELDNIIAAR